MTSIGYMVDDQDITPDSLRLADTAEIWADDIVVYEVPGDSTTPIDHSATLGNIPDNDIDAVALWHKRFGARVYRSGPRVWAWSGSVMKALPNELNILERIAVDFSLQLREAMQRVEASWRNLAEARAMGIADPDTALATKEAVMKEFANDYKSRSAYARRLLMNSGNRSLLAVATGQLTRSEYLLDADVRYLTCTNCVLDMQEFHASAQRAKDAASAADPDGLLPLSPGGGRFTEMELGDWRTSGAILTPHENFRQTLKTEFPVPQPRDHSAPPVWRGTLWDRYLEEALPDVELQEWLRRVCGAMLFGTPEKEKKVYNLFGPGDTSKSMFISVLEAALGTFSRPMDVKLLTDNTVNDAFELDGLRGKRLATSAEPTAGNSWNEGLIKKITGGDKVTSRGMYRSMDSSGGEWRFRATLFVASNSVMRFSTSDVAMARRIVPVPFVVQFTTPDKHTDAQIAQEAENAKKMGRAPAIRRRDDTVGDRLKEPGELAAIGAWLLQGAWEWAQMGGGVLPQAVERMKEKVMDDLDTAVLWTREMLASGHIQIVVPSTGKAGAAADGAPNTAVRDEDEMHGYVVEGGALSGYDERLSVKTAFDAYTAWMKTEMSANHAKGLRPFRESVIQVYGNAKECGSDRRSRFVGLRPTDTFPHEMTASDYTPYLPRGN